MKRFSPWLMLLIILTLATLSCQASIFPMVQNNRVSTPVAIILTPPTDAILPDEPVDLEYQDTLLTTLYEKVNPGVVSIQALSESGSSLGSGLVYDKAGHVITNYHVVEGASDLEVDFPSGMKVRGKVIGKDVDSDLAVIKVDAPQEALFPLELGDSNQLKIGQTVIAIGNPFGLTGTMTVGIVSARGRTLDSLRESRVGGNFVAGGIIQNDAAINPGNSGCPLLNLNGKVIGINRAIRTDNSTATGEPTNSGIGFAVPINIVKRVMPILIEKGSYDYPYLGISSQDEISLFLQEELGLSQATGAYVISVEPGGPADQAGLKSGERTTSVTGLYAGGDLIIAADGRPVKVFGDLLSYLMENKSPGDTIALNYSRYNKGVVNVGKRHE
jgi:2-alkenal reductase